MNGNDLLEHIEKCDRCSTLENVRSVLIESGFELEKVFTLLTDEQQECWNNSINEDEEVKADLHRKYDNPYELEKQENFCN